MSRLVEQLTPVNLSVSRGSHVCPTCGRFKAKGRSVCYACWRLLPRYVQTELLGPTEANHYIRAMLTAFRQVQEDSIILPGDKRAVSATPMPAVPRALLADGLRQSVASPLCPRCCGVKEAGASLCNRCEAVCRSALASIIARRMAQSPKDSRAAIQQLTDDIDPALAATDPKRFAEGMCRALRMTRNKIFYMPE